MPAPRSIRSVLSLAAFAVLASSTLPASADGPYLHSSEGEEHGSQVASSEWLPIIIGVSVGATVGALGGSAVDPSQPVVFGPIFGGAIGALAGGGGGAWVIRSVRDQDTHTAGTVTGVGIGFGFGALLAVKTLSKDNNGKVEGPGWFGRVPALVLCPIMGGLVGWKLADVSGPKKKKQPGDESFVPTHVSPSATPLVAHDGTPNGFAVGVQGGFF